MPSHPLAEVFGFPYDNLLDKAERYRNLKLCPFNNKVPSCTKNSVQNPLGVCSVFEKGSPVITCPIRFREDWLIIEDAANFFFKPTDRFTSLSEIRLNDAEGNSAGNIDFVLVSLDEQGSVVDFGALEVQAVYISGNVSKPFNYYLGNRQQEVDFDWTGVVRPDYLSSSRKRLVPQLIYKGRILREWRKKIAVVLQDSFFATLPELPTVPPEDADVAWLIYKMEKDPDTNLFNLVRNFVVYTSFTGALDKITTPHAGDVNQFLTLLQSKLEKNEQVYPPINLTLFDTFTED